MAFPRGQVDLKPYIFGTITSAVLSVSSWFGGTTWTKYNANEDARREREEVTRVVKAHSEQIAALRGQGERFERAIEDQRETQKKGLAEILAAVRERKHR